MNVDTIAKRYIESESRITIIFACCCCSLLLQNFFPVHRLQNGVTFASFLPWSFQRKPIIATPHTYIHKATAVSTSTNQNESTPFMGSKAIR